MELYWLNRHVNGAFGGSEGCFQAPEDVLSQSSYLPEDHSMLLKSLPPKHDCMAVASPQPVAAVRRRDKNQQLEYDIVIQDENDLLSAQSERSTRASASASGSELGLQSLKATI